MKPHATTLATLLLAACSGGGGSGGSTATPVGAPSPTPTPSSVPSPTPSPTPTASPSPAAASYPTIADIYVNRFGSGGVTLSSACSGFVFSGQPPAVAAPTAFGDGPAFRFIVTPNVWSVGGVGGFDARDGDPFAGMFPDPVPGNVEVGYSRAAGPEPVRFSVTRPTAEGVDLAYARLGLTWTPAGGVRTQTHCVLGVPTVAAELPAAPAGAFRRTATIATAYVREGAATRAYALGRSTAALAFDPQTGRVTVSLRLVGTAVGTAGADLALGTYTASAAVDPATGNFTAPLAGDHPVTGAVSGRLFGPAAVEIGVAFDAAVPAAAGAPEYSVAGAVFGIR